MVISTSNKKWVPWPERLVVVAAEGAMVAADATLAAVEVGAAGVEAALGVWAGPGRAERDVVGNEIRPPDVASG